MMATSVGEARGWRNAPILREPDIRRTRWLWRLLLCFAAALAPFVVHLLQQMDYVSVRYKIEELRAQHERLVEMEQRLRIERARLVTPARVEARATRDLSLVRPEPWNVVVLRPSEPRDGELMARAPARR